MIKKHKLHGVMELSRDISYTGSIMLTKHSPLTRIFTRGDLVSLYIYASAHVAAVAAAATVYVSVVVAPAVYCIDFVAIVFATIVVVVLLLLLFLLVLLLLLLLLRLFML